ncbi:MAG: CYTH domain-containing protein [Acidimicrobiia bacterium]
MGIEIERKFLVDTAVWSPGAVRGVPMRQGYIASSDRAVVRIRLEGARGVLTIKGRTTGVSRAEYEYEIPAGEADQMLASLAGALVEKTRYHVPHGGHVWDVDVFAGANAGLVMAEVELASPDEDFERPAWLGEEVSHDPRYRNSALAADPFTRWPRR